MKQPVERKPEPELMDNPEQARAYAEADFSEPHNHFVALFAQRNPDMNAASVLDLGCGPGDICRRFARAYPDCQLHGVDASAPMLALGESANRTQNLHGRITLFQSYLPEADLPQSHYDIIISNSLLHHLKQPDSLWQCIRKFGRAETRVFIMDLLRPDSVAQAQQLQETYAGDEPRILQEDFYNSLLAAYRPAEIEAQLKANDLTELTVEVVSDRHLIIWGTLKIN
jgi:ubiquinone/menaquinone biosynthesis C-methylase UbiE